MSAEPAPIRLEQLRGPLAFLADIHGNLPALDAVLEACRAEGASAYFVAGDLFFRGDQPLEVWKRLIEIGARCTRGTSDVALAALDPQRIRPRDARERERLDRFLWTRRALGELILARLRRLPDALRIELGDGSEIAMGYGSPLDPTEPITHDLTEDEASALLGTDPADVVISGGADVPFTRDVCGVRVVGLGSVGDSAAGRIAHYALIEPGTDGLSIRTGWVEY